MYKLPNVFVQIAKCICTNCKMYLYNCAKYICLNCKMYFDSWSWQVHACSSHRMYLYKLQNVFVQITKCICANCKIYLSKCQVQFMCHALPPATQVMKPHMSHMADRIREIHLKKNQRNMCYKITEVLISHHHKTAFVAWPLSGMS